MDFTTPKTTRVLTILFYSLTGLFFLTILVVSAYYAVIDRLAFQGILVPALSLLLPFLVLVFKMLVTNLEHYDYGFKIVDGNKLVETEDGNEKIYNFSSIVAIKKEAIVEEMLINRHDIKHEIVRPVLYLRDPDGKIFHFLIKTVPNVEKFLFAMKKKYPEIVIDESYRSNIKFINQKRLLGSYDTNKVKLYAIILFGIMAILGLIFYSNFMHFLTKTY